MSCLRYLCLFACGVDRHILYCILFLHLLYPVFSSFSGLSIFDCPLGILERLFISHLMLSLWTCSDCLVFFGTVPTCWYIWICLDNVAFVELFRLCDNFETVPTMWYFWNCSNSAVFLELFRQWYFLNTSDSVVFLELFQQCGIFGTLPTVWYFWNSSNSVVFLELFRQCDIFGTLPPLGILERLFISHLMLSLGFYFGNSRSVVIKFYPTLSHPRLQYIWSNCFIYSVCK
jgi:hypothetical protein